MTSKSETSSDRGHFEILEGFPVDVVAVVAHGRVEHEDYAQTLVPLIDERIRAEGKVHVYCELGPDFEGFTPGAAWDDAKLGLIHRKDFGRFAVVTDKEWIRLGVKMFAPFFPGKIRVFPYAEREAARQWILGRGEEPDEFVEVAATEKPKTITDVA